jgi:hypothetical protein
LTGLLDVFFDYRLFLQLFDLVPGLRFSRLIRRFPQGYFSFAVGISFSRCNILHICRAVAAVFALKDPCGVYASKTRWEYRSYIRYWPDLAVESSGKILSVDQERESGAVAFLSIMHTPFFLYYLFSIAFLFSSGSF